MTWAVAGLLPVVLGLAIGAPGFALAACGSLIWQAWRFDNHSGSLLVLAVLTLIALAVPAMLLTLMAVTR